MAKKKENMFASIGKLSTESKKIQEQVKKLAQSKVTPALKEAFIDLKNVIPTLETIKWQQFTPYFNDGDSCEFSLQMVYIKLAENDTAGDSEDGFIDSYSLESLGLTNLEKDAFGSFEEELKGIESLLKDAFGDHAEVVLTSKGIVVEEFSHD